MAWRTSGGGGGHGQLDQLLQQVPAYGNKNIVRVHVFSLLSATNICRMTPKVGNLMDNTGRSQKLLSLDGTITILYKGNQFHIPVEIWIPTQYPNVSPTVYVRPTQEMMIKPNHRHVGNDGMVYIDYLSQWNNRHSNLVDAVKHCSSVFGMEPPVFKKPANHPPPSYSQPPAYQAQSVTQPQVTYDPNTGQPVQTRVTYDPNTGQPVHTSMAGAAHAVAVATHTSHNPPSYDQALRTSGIGNSPTLAHKPGLSAKEQLLEELAGQIQHELEKFSRQCTDEMDKCFSDQRRLEEHKEVINQSLESMRDAKEKLSVAIKETEEKTANLEEWLAKQTSDGDSVDVNKIILPSDPLSRQAFEAVAEDAAIDDALYHLDKALYKENIDLPSYLKEVRNLAEQQFMARALAAKIFEAQKA